MHWKMSRNQREWHQVPYAWFPVAYGDDGYWLEWPPWQRRIATSQLDTHWEYRKCER